jgi:hypothetical protein
MVELHSSKRDLKMGVDGGDPGLLGRVDEVHLPLLLLILPPSLDENTAKQY